MLATNLSLLTAKSSVTQILLDDSFVIIFVGQALSTHHTFFPCCLNKLLDIY